MFYHNIYLLVSREPYQLLVVYRIKLAGISCDKCACISWKTGAKVFMWQRNVFIWLWSKSFYTQDGGWYACLNGSCIMCVFAAQSHFWPIICISSHRETHLQCFCDNIAWSPKWVYTSLETGFLVEIGWKKIADAASNASVWRGREQHLKPLPTPNTSQASPIYVWPCSLYSQLRSQITTYVYTRFLLGL